MIFLFTKVYIGGGDEDGYHSEKSDKLAKAIITAQNQATECMDQKQAEDAC